MEAQVYSVEECAQILHIGRQLAYELIRQNKLPAIRLGAKRLVVPRVALERTAIGVCAASLGICPLINPASTSFRSRGKGSRGPVSAPGSSVERPPDRRWGALPLERSRVCEAGALEALTNPEKLTPKGVADYDRR